MEPSYPDVIPMIAYEDRPRAMDWLSTAFGEDVEGHRWMFIERS